MPRRRHGLRPYAFLSPRHRPLTSLRTRSRGYGSAAPKLLCFRLDNEPADIHLSQFFQELNRRNVLPATLAYLASSWLLLLLVDLLLDSFTAPVWVMPALQIVLALGLPVIVFLAWAFQVTPEGIRRDPELARSKSVSNSARRKLYLITIMALTLAVLVYLADRHFASPRAGTAVPVSAAVTGAPGIDRLPSFNPASAMTGNTSRRCEYS